MPSLLSCIKPLDMHSKIIKWFDDYKTSLPPYNHPVTWEWTCWNLSADDQINNSSTYTMYTLMHVNQVFFPERLQNEDALTVWDRKSYLQLTACGRETSKSLHRREGGRLLPCYLHTDESLTAVSELFQTRTHNHLFTARALFRQSTIWSNSSHRQMQKIERTDSNQRCYNEQLHNDSYLWGGKPVRAHHLCPITSLWCNWLAVR